MTSSLPGGGAFKRATTLFLERKFVEAENACRELLAQTPRDAKATHLLGLIRKDAGDTAGAEQLLRQSVALQPRNAEFRANLGNLLRRLQRLADAQNVYREALAIDPSHFNARFGLALTLNDQTQHVAAEAEARRLVAMARHNAQAWFALAMALRDQQRLPEAEAAYRQTLEITPDLGPAHHNLGSVLSQLDRPEEALESLERAAALGVNGFELEFNRGRALLELYRADDAEKAFAAAVAANPRHTEAHANLARVRYMRGDPQFARDIATAAANNADDMHLSLLHAAILRRAGDLPGAESLLRDLSARLGSSPAVRTSLAGVLHESGQLEEAEFEAMEAAAEQPHDSAILENLVAILLARGRPDDAMPFVMAQRSRNPHHQGWLAHEATAARLLGSPRYRELYDYDHLIRLYDIETPPGWSSMGELNDALVKALAARHRFASHPLDQSLRNGSQTARSLLTDPDPAIRAVLQAFLRPIEHYRNLIGRDPRHPLSARNSGAAAYAGAWSVQLRREGFHVNHVHPQGWISSAYYVSVPQEVEDQTLRSGWLKFGETRYPVPGATTERFVQPRAGRLVLFPSYMWHGTNPIHGGVPRTSIAFDVVPAAQPRTI